MSTITFPSINPRRYRAVKQAVRERCASLGLCPDAARQCIDRAAKELRNGRSAAVAISDGIALAKRLARFADRVTGGAA